MHIINAILTPIYCIHNFSFYAISSYIKSKSLNLILVASQLDPTAAKAGDRRREAPPLKLQELRQVWACGGGAEGECDGGHGGRRISGKGGLYHQG